MKKFFLSDHALKIISVIVAVILWLYIIIVLDPAVEIEVRDLPIQFLGSEVLESKGLSVVNESATTLNLKIKGSRKRMGRYDMKTIIAKVDLSEIRIAGQASLPVEVVVPFENVGISSQNHYQVDVKTEKLVSKEMRLEIKTEGSLAQEYMAGPMRVEPETVRVKGPESVLGKLSKAAVVLNYGGADLDITQELPIRFYDTDGKERAAQDALLKRIASDRTSAKVDCEVLKLRTVEIVPQFSAAAPEGEQALLNGTEYSINPQTVQIYGDDELTAKISSIHTEKISAERFVDNRKAKAKLVIPQGVKILRDISEVEITLTKGGKTNGE